ncbi:hypothetical protein A6279_27040 [Bacillus wiedmannii]|uniref:hypothetical protein n=1 Tax=Bacillus TaxID=1386 RepID=UPI0007DAF577|nr:hypothetical protein [Bacillus wiedmannii]OAK05976.1 hypothetical protein A6278_27065 [Bacillus wiedmannii]OAK08386.1 hypothetical protein A6279_27040 [Bacillus wiedmannii]
MKSPIIDMTNLKGISFPIDQIQKVQDAMDVYNKSLSLFESLTKSIALQETIYQKNLGAITDFTNQATKLTEITSGYSTYKSAWEKILIPINQIQKKQGMINEYHRIYSMINNLSYSPTLLNIISEITIPTPALNMLSSINLDEMEEFLVLEEVQEEIEHEIVSFQEQTNPQKISDTINNFAKKLIDFQEDKKQTAPAFYILLIISYFIFNHFIAPAMEDVFKENVLHVSEFTSNKPEENAKQVKTSLEKDFGIALSAINKVRVTNRETPVFRSHQRSSGAIDTIPHNKAVIIIEKKRNWSFIMYTNSLDEEVNGWVFTGNLSR